MKPLQIIPNHNTLSESFFPGSPHQVSIFTQKLQEDNEPVVIYATNYNNQNFERVFMVPKNRCPTWQEMVELKDMFWYPNEATFQVHPEKQDYVNDVTTALHLWRPKSLYGIRKLDEACALVKRTVANLKHSQSTELYFTTGVSEGKHYVAIFCGKEWPSWEEVCKIKHHCFGDECTALQFNINRNFDLGFKRILTLWNADELDIPLPPKEIV